MRFTRLVRTALAVAAAVVAAIVASAVAPAHAVNLRWAAQNDILTFDPHSQNHATTITMLIHVYEPLVRYDKNFQIEPALATSWQQVTPTQWRFNLRKNVKFHDGSRSPPMTWCSPTSGSSSRRERCRFMFRGSRK